jgi:hypothetical protein
MAFGEFILHRFNGDEVFRLGTATIFAYRTEDGIRVNLDAETDGMALKTVADTAQDPANPRAEVAFVVEALDVGMLVGQRFLVPHGRTRDDDLASIYYYEHEDLNENVVEFLGLDGDRFRVRWTASARDVNYYDGSKPKTKLEVEGWFQFEKFGKWSTTPDASDPR